MPWGLKRFQEARNLHFITFSCYERAPLLNSPEARHVFEQTLERVRQWYGIYVAGYVVMPEHVHLLITEPEGYKLSVVIQMLKQNVAQQLGRRPRPVSPKNGETRTGHPFWYARYYDFNVWSGEKRIEKLRYIHRNPVKRGLVEKPEDWEWSSFRHYVSGVEGAVEIESQWTVRKREQSDVHLAAQDQTGLALYFLSDVQDRHQAAQDVCRPLQLRDNVHGCRKLRSSGHRLDPLSEVSQLREAARP
jgi:putative transposase